MSIILYIGVVFSFMKSLSDLYLRSLSFSFLYDIEGNTNISVAIKSISTVRNENFRCDKYF